MAWLVAALMTALCIWLFNKANDMSDRLLEQESTILELKLINIRLDTRLQQLKVMETEIYTELKRRPIMIRGKT